MKTISVAAAILCDDPAAPHKIFATARGYGDQKGGWEFPGGKLEPGETPQQALVREIQEELDIAISVEQWLDRIEYDYPAFHLSMDCFLCRIQSGEIRLKEALAAQWLTKESLYSVNWLPADRVILPKLEAILSADGS